MMPFESLLFLGDLDCVENSVNTETPQDSVYGQPKSFSMSGQRGEDRYGHVDNVGLESPIEVDTCDTCLGSGVVDEKSCPQCHGTGLIRNDSQEEVDSAYESTEISGDGKIVQAGHVINSTGTDNYGIGQNGKDFSSHNLFLDLSPYAPSLDKGLKRYGSDIEVLNGRLVGSAPTREQIIQGLQRYFYSDVRLVDAGNGTYEVHNTKGKIDGVVVKEQNGRWRAELT